MVKTVEKIVKHLQSGRINWLGNIVELLDLVDENIKIVIRKHMDYLYEQKSLNADQLWNI